jgi:hypothetical protein
MRDLVTPLLILGAYYLLESSQNLAFHSLTDIAQQAKNVKAVSRFAALCILRADYLVALISVQRMSIPRTY